MAKKQSQKQKVAKKAPQKFRGIVVSTKMEKTIVVEVKKARPHPIYKKIFYKISKLKAHDEKEEAKEGDFVEIEACRPISKEKHFILKKILKSKNK